MSSSAVGADARPDLGRSLHVVLQAYVEGARPVLADLPGGARGFRVLQVVASGTCRNQAGIAGALGLDRTVMTHAIDDLEAAGLVERRPDPQDRRARQIVLTEQGKARAAAAEEEMRRLESRLLAVLEPGDATRLLELLDRVARASGPVPTLDAEACAGTCDGDDAP